MSTNYKKCEKMKRKITNISTQLNIRKKNNFEMFRAIIKKEKRSKAWNEKLINNIIKQENHTR